jgi:hypothetical protein
VVLDMAANTADLGKLIAARTDTAWNTAFRFLNCTSKHQLAPPVVECRALDTRTRGLTGGFGRAYEICRRRGVADPAAEASGASGAGIGPEMAWRWHKWQLI